jgi:TPR repeat protein
LNPKPVLVAALLAAALPAAGQQDASRHRDPLFTEITPGDVSIDPGNLIAGAQMGDVRAINNLGLLWARGIGVPAPDYKEAMRWWKEAARRGYTVSMNNLGLLYASGHGVEQDYAQAFKWWEMSAEAGDPWAMNSIGDLYENGQGVEQSYARALEWYQRAAEAGDGLALYNLGHLYEEGLGVERNARAAMGWYERAADQGVGLSMYMLGKMLAEGRGVPGDPAEAHAWMTVAQGYFTAEDAKDAEANARALAALAPTLSAQQLARSGAIAANLQVRIEERRKQRPLQAGPGESDT